MAEEVEERRVTSTSGLGARRISPANGGKTSASGDAETATHANASRGADRVHGLSHVAEIESTNSCMPRKALIFIRAVRHASGFGVDLVKYQQPCHTNVRT